MSLPSNYSISLIGAPTDAGAGMRGASMGPEALRVAGLAQALSALGIKVHDRGDVSGPPHPTEDAAQPPQSAEHEGLRHFSQVKTWNRAVYEGVRAALVDGQLPILLGGDHSLAIGSIGAAAHHAKVHQQKLRVLWLDAHADFNTAALTPSGNIHGMPVAALCGQGSAALRSIHEQNVSFCLSPQDIKQIGIRSVDAGEKRLVHEMGIEVFDMRYIDEYGMRHTMQQALLGVDANTHLHVSLDVDFLDPDIAPGVGTRVRGGPTYREAQLCMEMIADTGLLASLDIVELNPACDRENMSALLVVDLVESLFGKSTLMRQEPALRKP